MGFYTEKVLPRIEAKALAAPRIHDIRSRVCAALHGDVVEIGFGSGLNVEHYPPSISQVHAIEPSAVARQLAVPRIAASPVPVVFDGTDGQHLPLADESIDCALVTWTLCTIPDPAAAARELHRVLVPGGFIAYLEHGASPDPNVMKWQHRLNRVNQITSGCRLNTKAPQVFESSGFALATSTEYYLKGTPKWTGYLFEGTAVKAA